MKRKALAIVLTLLMLVSVLPMGAFAASYTDTEGHWAEKSIDRWTEAKVLEGMGNNTYAPDDHLTRAQAMTIFSRLLNLVETADISNLTDVAADAWYAPYVEKGYAYQIINGTSDTTFDPAGSITREQFFSVFARAVGIPSASTCEKTFTDLDQVSPWFVEEGTVYSMINRGYLDGYPDGSLQPKGLITRAEVAKVLDNAISDYITEDGTYPVSGDGIVVVLAKNVKLTGTFTGHIASSCVNATLDLSGLTRPAVKVAVNPAADNVTVNGSTKVTNPPYAPDSAYNPNSAPYVYVLQDNTNIITARVGGGGGGGADPKYVVRIAVSDLANLNGDPEVVGYLYNDTATAKDVFDAVSAGFAATTNGFNNIAKQMLGQGEGDVKVDAEGNITVDAKGDVDFAAFLNNLDTRYKNHMGAVSSDPAVKAAFDAFAAATAPSQLVADQKISGATAQAYAEKVFTELGTLVAAIQDSGTTFTKDQYADMMSEVFNFIGMENEDVDKLAEVLAATTKSSDAVIDSTKNASEVTYVELSGNIADSAEAIAQLGSRLDASYAGTDNYSLMAQSIMKAAVDGKNHLLQGDYHVTVTVEPYAG